MSCGRFPWISATRGPSGNGSWSAARARRHDGATSSSRGDHGWAGTTVRCLDVPSQRSAETRTCVRSTAQPDGGVHQGDQERQPVDAGQVGDLDERRASRAACARACTSRSRSGCAGRTIPARCSRSGSATGSTRPTTNAIGTASQSGTPTRSSLRISQIVMTRNRAQ